MRAKMSILALPWARQVNNLRSMFQQLLLVDSAGAASVVDNTGAAIDGEGVAPRDMVRDGVPKGDVDDAGDGHSDGEGDDLAELLRECRGAFGEHRPVTQSLSSFNGEDGDGERSGW